MAWQPPEGMEEYLGATELCNCDNAGLQKRAKEIIEGAETPKEAAMKIFSFVRELPWKVDNNDTKASKTLSKGLGQCVNKTNLQIALLRAVGIPARYHQVNMKKEWLEPVVSGSMYKRIPEIVWWHPWCECYLDGKWVACESVFDEALYKAMLQEGLVTEEQIPTIDWDGESDLIVVKPWLTEDAGTFPSLDDVFKKAQREVSRPRILAWLLGWYFRCRSNRHTDGIRKKWKPPEAAPEEA